MVTLELQDNEAELFKVFLEHEAFVHAFQSAGGFGYKNGSITIHYDQYGVAREFVKQERLKINYRLDYN